MISPPVIHVVDDDEGVRHSLECLLRDSGYKVRSYRSAECFLENPKLESGCVVSDVRMPGMDGLALLQKLRTVSLNLPVVIITAHGDVSLAVAAMKAGAMDFLEKPFDASVLIRAIENCLGFMSGQSGEKSTCRVSGELRAKLTVRELQVLELLVSGHSNKVIAQKLGISHRTVEFHRANIMEKMECQRLADLVRIWMNFK